MHKMKNQIQHDLELQQAIDANNPINPATDQIKIALQNEREGINPAKSAWTVVLQYTCLYR